MAKEIKEPYEVYKTCYRYSRVNCIDKDWMITKNFAWYEAFVNEASSDGVPSYDIFVNIYETARIMQAIRDYLDAPIHVHSWYRCVLHNKRAGSTATLSPHIRGNAVDFHVDTLSVSKTREKILKKGFPVRIEDSTTSWVHIDTGNPYIRGGYNWGMFKP